MNRLFGFQLLVACSFAFSFSCFAEGLTVAITHDAIDPERCMDLATDKKRLCSISAALLTLKNGVLIQLMPPTQPLKIWTYRMMCASSLH